MTNRVKFSYVCLGVLVYMFIAVSVLTLIVPVEKIVTTGQISVYNTKTRVFRIEGKDNYEAKESDVIQSELGKMVKERNYLIAIVGFVMAGYITYVGYKDYKNRC